MLVAIVFIFAVCLSFSLFEENMKKRDKLLVMAAVGLVMILIAGTRGVLDTPDSENYESMFDETTSIDDDSIREPSFSIISYYLNMFGFGINALFFVYAFLSVPLRLGAIWKLSKWPLLTLSIYISFYYQLHDLVQIRCAVASAAFFFAIYYHLEHRNKMALLWIAIGVFFHYSAVAGLLIFLFNNKPLERRHILFLLGVLLFGVAFYFSGLDISFFVPEQLGGDRMQFYRQLKENGIEGDLEGLVFYKNPMVLTNIALYLGCIYFHKTLTEQYKYLPFMLKMMAVAFFFLLTMTNISSVVSSRLYEYFDVVSIFLWTAVIYAFKPAWGGKVLVHVVSSARLLYSVLIYTLHL